MTAREPAISQTRGRRVADLGKLPNGDPCTLLFLKDPDGDGWRCYRFGVSREAIALTGDDVRKIVRVLRGDP